MKNKAYLVKAFNRTDWTSNTISFFSRQKLQKWYKEKFNADLWQNKNNFARLTKIYVAEEGIRTTIMPIEDRLALLGD